MNKSIRKSKKQLETINDHLSERDKLILETIEKFHYLTTNQIKRLFFSGSLSHLAAHRATNRALARLKAFGFIVNLERRIGGIRAGSASYVWCLGPTGARLLQFTSDSQANSSRKRVFEPSRSFLEHTLAISETYVQLYSISKQHDTIELLEITPEPDCWRSYVASSGAATYLKPDLYVASSNGDFEDHWFIEIDLSTEAPSRIVRKCQQYYHYYKSGSEQRKSGIFPMVVWIAKDSKRVDSIKNSLASEFSSEQQEIFIIITPDQLENLIINGFEMFRNDASNIT